MRVSLSVSALLLAAVVGAAGCAAPVRAADAVDIAAAVKSTIKSLVIVDYTFHNDNGSSQESGQGIVLTADGVIAIPGSLLPDRIPMEYVKDITVRSPAQEFAEVPAEYLGRSADGLTVLLKAQKPLDATPLDLAKTQGFALGQKIYSVGLLSKGGDYQPYVAISHVHATLPMTHELVYTETFGLTRTNSPVFDAATGALIGISAPPTGDTVVMRTESGQIPVELRDDEQPGVFLPIADIITSLDSMKTPAQGNQKADYPRIAFKTQRPWVGIGSATGLTEDLRNLYHIKDRVGIVVGSVVPGQPADKAGLKARDIITAVDGKAFPNTPVPEFMGQQFSRLVDELRPGTTMKLTVLRPVEGTSDVKTLHLPMTIGAAPPQGAEMPLLHNARLGLTTRDLVFFDTYGNKLPADTKGAMVTLVKSGAPASLGNTPVHPGYIITKVNDTPVTSAEQLNQLLTAATAPDKKEVVLVALDSHGETAVLRIDLTGEAASKGE